MLTDISDRSADVRVLERQHVGRAPRHDPQRFHQPGSGLDPPSLHQNVEHAGRLVTRARSVGHDARQRRGGQVAKQLVIIDADHGHLVGNIDFQFAAYIEHLPATNVVRRQDAHRLGQCDQPAA